MWAMRTPSGHSAARAGTAQVALLALLAVSGAAGDEDLARSVDAALELARGALLSGRELAGELTVGEMALAALAALRAGASPSHPAVSGALARAFADVRAATADAYVGTYHAALLLLLLEQLAERRTAWAPPSIAEELAGRLLELRDDRGGWGDLSRTGFAAAGLDAADRLGVRVGSEVWRALEEYLERSQLENGGWAYRRESGLRPTGSMTAEGVASLLYAGGDPGSPAASRAIAWLRSHFAVDSNPGEDPAARTSTGSAAHRFYYLAALAALARAAGGFPEPHWAREGASALVREQRPDGTWAGDAHDFPTAFAALFLSEARLELGPGRHGARAVVTALAPGGRGLDPAAVRALELALVRWTGLGTGLELRALGRGELPAAGSLLRRSALVALLVDGESPPAEDDLRELAAFVRGGGFVVVEGGPGCPEAEVLALASRLAPRPHGESAASRPAVAAIGWDSEVLAGPASRGATSPPRLFALAANDGSCARVAVLAAPEGLYTILGSRGIGVRSGVARAAVNVFAYASSR